MDKFTIYCTEEQVKKAFQLGAPIEANKDYSNGNLPNTLCVYGDIINKDAYGIGECTILHIPTAEQVVGWLRTKGCFAYVLPVRKEHQSVLAARCCIPCDGGSCDMFCAYCEDNSVILKAIDEVLNYLIRQQNNVR